MDGWIAKYLMQVARSQAEGVRGNEPAFQPNNNDADILLLLHSGN